MHPKNDHAANDNATKVGDAFTFKDMHYTTYGMISILQRH